MEPSAIQMGTVVDRYTVEAVLGEGGMAIVYRVRHNVLGTLHALKVLTLSSRSIRERLRQEGQLQARLQHPNIVAVTDVIDLGGAPGLIMEYIDGPSLEDLLRRGRLTFAQVDELAEGLFAGVGEAHRQGFIHRDLKPANVLIKVTERGVIPKVADFGLAKAIRGSDPGRASTRTGSTMGTPHYMSPEQVRDAKSVGARSDIFALGAILYEMVTGERAFQGEDLLDIFNAIAQGRYPPPRALVPDLPERMERAIAAALQTEQEARPESVEALAALWRGGEVQPAAAGAFDVSALSSPPREPSPPPSVGSSTPDTTDASSAREPTWTGGTLSSADPARPALARSTPPLSGKAIWAVGVGGVFAVLFVAALALMTLGGGLLWAWTSQPSEIASAPTEHAQQAVEGGKTAAPEPARPDAPEPAIAEESPGETPQPKEAVAIAQPKAPASGKEPATGSAALPEVVPAEAPPSEPAPVQVAEGEPAPVQGAEAESEPGEQPAAEPPAEAQVEPGPMLASDDPAERRTGVYNLIRRKDDEACQLLGYVVRNEKDFSVRELAWAAVLDLYDGRQGNVEILEDAIVWQMGHLPKQSAMEAVKAYKKWGQEPHEMKGALGHPSKNVRIAALDALPTVVERAGGKVNYAELVGPLLQDPDPDVKRKAETFSGL